MVKYCWILLLILLNINISIEGSLSNCYGEQNTGKECSKLFTEEEKEDNLCCLVTGLYLGENKKECQEFENLNKDRDEAEEAFEEQLELEGYTNVKVDCKSYHLQFTLIFLILILL